MIHRTPDHAGTQPHELAIIGGGIYGIATALEAARRGLRPVLIERRDFGHATSWNSLRILHGGLRYLQTLDIARFRESVRERRWFCWHFPELIRPLPCLMPLYGRGLKRASAMRTALWMNDHLSRNRNHGVPQHLNLPGSVLLGPAETVMWFPQVHRPGLQGAALWYDAVMINSQRILIEMLKWACACGAVAMNYVEATQLIVKAGRVQGVVATDTLNQRQLEIAAPIVINCAGPWSSDVAGRFTASDMSHLFRPSLAFNILLDRPAMSSAAVAVQAPHAASPVCFVQPWRGRLLAGTAHAPCNGRGAGASRPTDMQVSAFLDQINAAIPGLNLTLADVRRIYAGCLPVQRDGGTELTSRPVIHSHADHDGPVGLVSVTGIKFTTARDVAEQALRLAWSARGPLPHYQPHTDRPVSHPRLDLTSPESLFRGDTSFTQAELARIVREEAVMHLDDLLLRRTDWACDATREPELTRCIKDLLNGASNQHPHSNIPLTP